MPRKLRLWPLLWCLLLLLLYWFRDEFVDWPVLISNADDDGQIDADAVDNDAAAVADDVVDDAAGVDGVADVGSADAVDNRRHARHFVNDEVFVVVAAVATVAADALAFRCCRAIDDNADDADDVDVDALS